MTDLALTDLAQAIEHEHQAAHQAAQTALAHALECGQLLLQAKAAVGHGGWLAWVEANLTFGPRQATNYMRLAREIPKLDDEDRKQVSDLTMRDAVGQLALNARAIARLPEGKVAEVIDDAESAPLKLLLGRAEAQQQRRKSAGSEPDREKWTTIPWQAYTLADDRLLAAIEQVISDFDLPPQVVLETLQEAYCRIQEGSEIEMEMSRDGGDGIVLQ
jgi:hypothetical protein